jgi:hypothetical protein
VRATLDADHLRPAGAEGGLQVGVVEDLRGLRDVGVGIVD